MDQVLSWLNDPINKTVLMFLGGLILKKWGAFVNRAIPVALLAVSTLLAVLKALFPTLVPDAQAATSAVNAAVGVSSTWHFILTTVIAPVLVAVGLHSTSKNTKQWVEFGAKVIEAVPAKK